jgi:hypothetical protein
MNVDTPSKPQPQAMTPAELARQCLAEAHNDPDRAIALAGKRARGAKLRATYAVIGNALMRASAK